MPAIHNDTPRSRFVSAVTAVGSPVTLTLDEVATNRAHCFVACRFFSDSGGETQVTPSAGSVAITIETDNNEGIFEAPSDNSITANDPKTKSWSANTKRVRATPSGITGATHYELRVTCNAS